MKKETLWPGLLNDFTEIWSQPLHAVFELGFEGLVLFGNRNGQHKGVIHSKTHKMRSSKIILLTLIGKIINFFMLNTLTVLRLSQKLSPQQIQFDEVDSLLRKHLNKD